MQIAFNLSVAEKLNLIRVIYASDLSPTAMRIAHLFVDVPGSRYWSNARLAIAVRRSVRTVEKVLAELRSVGFFLTVRRRRQTAIKVLCVERIIALGKQGVAAAKQACSVAISLLRKGKSLTRSNTRPISLLDIRKADVSAPWRVEARPSASLLRHLGMPTGERRQEP